MKLIFIDQEPLTPRRKKVFEIDALRKNGFEVGFWDMSEFCFKGVNINNIITDDFVTKIISFQLYKAKVKEQSLSDTLFIFEGYLALIKPELNNYARKLNALTVRFEINTTSKLPSLNWKDKINRLSGYSFWEINKRLISVITLKIKKLYYKPYTAVISTGNIIPADRYVNHSDYIQYLELKECPPVLQYPYIVFLDQFYPYHPDFKCQGINIEKNANAFFCDLNRYFDKIEKEYGIKVVIAAHPKANYDPAIFSNRKIVYGKTNLLVKDATAVIAISSASISFAVMNDKPLALIITNDMINTKEIRMDIVHYQRYLANMFDKDVYNISNPSPSLAIKKLSPQIRQNYLYSYLTSPGIEHISNADLLPAVFRALINKK